MRAGNSPDPTGRFSLAGRSILITGATGTLGRTAANGFARAGAQLTLAGGNGAELDAVASVLGPIAKVTAVNLRPEQPTDAAAMVDAAVDSYGRIDGVVVASGMNRVAAAAIMAVTDFEMIMNANVRGSWLVCQAVGRQLLKQGDGGSIVLVSSTRGRLGHPAGYSAYCPSKAAVDLLAKSLAAEWGPDNIRVNALAPTLFRSNLTQWIYGDDDAARNARASMLSRIPLGRLAEPDDLLGALIFLLSDASAFMTGQVLYVDGGYTAC
jgi:NAD(P)-dependent dehydrogenase (short-subunit alcohol dehydrogenase family)